MTAASGTWQIAFFVLCAVYLGFAMWRGWKRGFVRGFTGLVALIVGFFAGMGLGSALAGWLAAISPVFGMIVGSMVGLLVGIALYVAIRLLGAVLLKKTEHQKSGMLRFLYGLGGALVGAVIAFFVIGGIVSLIGVMGSVAESRPESQKSRGFSGALLDGAARLKESVGMGKSGKMVEKTDVIPDQLRELLDAVLRLSANPAAAERLMEYPGIRPVIEDPRMAELTSDPEIVRIVERQQYLQLLTHPKIWAAVNDPTLAAKLRNVDIREALQFAVGPSPDSSPIDPPLPKP